VELAKDPIFARVLHTRNVDQVIRTRFLHRARDRIHDKVCEFIHLAIQGIVTDHKESFIEEGFGAKSEKKV
jgi:hypothetical protein